MFFTEVSSKHLHWRWHHPRERDTLTELSEFPSFCKIIDWSMIFRSTSQFPNLHIRSGALELPHTGLKELTVHLSSHLYVHIGSITVVAWNEPCGNVNTTEIGQPYRPELLLYHGEPALKHSPVHNCTQWKWVTEISSDSLNITQHSSLGEKS